MLTLPRPSTWSGCCTRTNSLIALDWSGRAEASCCILHHLLSPQHFVLHSPSLSHTSRYILHHLSHHFGPLTQRREQMVGDGLVAIFTISLVALAMSRVIVQGHTILLHPSPSLSSLGPERVAARLVLPGGAVAFFTISLICLSPPYDALTKRRTVLLRGLLPSAGPRRHSCTPHHLSHRLPPPPVADAASRLQALVALLTISLIASARKIGATSRRRGTVAIFTISLIAGTARVASFTNSLIAWARFWSSGSVMLHPSPSLSLPRVRRQAREVALLTISLIACSPRSQLHPTPSLSSLGPSAKESPDENVLHGCTLHQLSHRRLGRWRLPGCTLHPSLS